MRFYEYRHEAKEGLSSRLDLEVSESIGVASLRILYWHLGNSMFRVMEADRILKEVSALLSGTTLEAVVE